MLTLKLVPSQGIGTTFITPSTLNLYNDKSQKCFQSIEDANKSMQDSLKES